MFTEKPLQPVPDPLNSLCEGTHHNFLIDAGSGIIPPGTPCACGQKVMIYEQCQCCGRSGRVLKDVRRLQEDSND